MKAQNLIIKLSVIGAHLLIIGGLLFDPPLEKPLKRDKKLMVQTISLSEKKVIEIQPPKEEVTYTEKQDFEESIDTKEEEPLLEKEKEVLPPKEVVTPKETSPPSVKIKEESKKTKKVEVKKESPKKEVKKEKPVKKKENSELNVKDLALLKNLEESVEKIGKKADKSSKNISFDLPKEITGLQIESTTNQWGEKSFEKHYEDDVALYLKSFLLLPEHGDVKINLTLKRNGRISSLKILKAKSDKNKNYIEKAMKDLQFPSFGTHFKGEEEHTFTITLTSAT